MALLNLPSLPALPVIAAPATPKATNTIHPQLAQNCGEFTCPDGSCPGPDGTCDNGASGNGCTFVCPDGSCGDYGTCGGGITGVPFPPGPPAQGPGGGSSGGSGGSGGSSGSQSSSGSCTNLWSIFTNPLQCALRLLFFILGIVCIIGAIYLFKPTTELVAGPARAVREAATAAGEGAALA